MQPSTRGVSYVVCMCCCCCVGIVKMSSSFFLSPTLLPTAGGRAGVQGILDRPTKVPQPLFVSHSPAKNDMFVLERSEVRPNHKATLLEREIHKVQYRVRYEPCQCFCTVCASAHCPLPMHAHDARSPMRADRLRACVSKKTEEKGGTATKKRKQKKERKRSTFFLCMATSILSYPITRRPPSAIIPSSCHSLK